VANIFTMHMIHGYLIEFPMEEVIDKAKLLSMSAVIHDLDGGKCCRPSIGGLHPYQI